MQCKASHEIKADPSVPSQLRDGSFAELARNMLSELHVQGSASRTADVQEVSDQSRLQIELCMGGSTSAKRALLACVDCLHVALSL